MAKSVASKGVPARTKKRRKSPTWVRWLKISFALLTLIFLAGAAVIGFMFMVAFKQAGDEVKALLGNKLTANLSKEMSTMFARDHKTILWTSSDERRDPIESYKEIPDSVIHATLAAEDVRFFDHAGVDYRAVVRSVFRDVREQRSAQGASTITMQLAKRLFTSPEKSMQRKIHDACLAIQIERQLTKEEVLRQYLNEVFYGNGAYGIKAASEVYFGKSDLKKLTISEAAMLARIVRTPSKENPYKDFKLAKKNRDVVLGIMRDKGWISEDQFKKALAEKVHLQPRSVASGEHIYRAPYFVRYVLDQLKRDLPDADIRGGGYSIETTLDPTIEAITEKEVKNIVHEFRRRRVTTAAFVTMDQDGQILSMVGGVDFEHHQYNAISQGRRQPGSSFKPIVYSAALSTGALRPGDSISSGPFVYKDPYNGKVWAPENDNGFGGYVSIRSALAQSINTCAARVIQQVTPAIAVQYAHNIFGYTSKLDPVLALCLGTSAVSPLEQAQAYSVFMLHGDRATPFGVLRVLGPDKNAVKVYQPDIRRGVLDANVAGQMDEYLRAVVTSGTGTAALIVKDARGKTGTTQDYRDAWFCGYTNNMVGIGWVANEKYDPKHNPPYYYEKTAGLFGGTVTARLWANIFKQVQRIKGAGDPREARRLEREIDIETDAHKLEPIGRDHSAPVDDNRGASDETVPADGNDTAPPPGDMEPASNVDRNPPPVTEAPKRSRRERRAENVDYVTVEVCADTGLKATIYCPETVRRRFPRGEEPSRYCRRHGPNG